MAFSIRLSIITLFQSTHPHGVRHKQVRVPDEAWVSIHAPTRGATANDRILASRLGVSIHAPTRGATLSFKLIHQIDKFQSTHPHGVRLYVTALLKYMKQCFNPRTHTGCDFSYRFFANVCDVSIHAPTRGATSFRTSMEQKKVVSIHAPTRGATQPIKTIQNENWFQSTHPHGVRRCSRWDWTFRSSRFNPRTHTGCDISVAFR